MHSSPFTVAGMSSSTSAHHSPNLNSLNSWGGSSTGGPLASSFGDSLSQSRSHYQSGYLMSASQNNNLPQGSPRADEVPTVQTKAKMNQILSRGSTTDFGMDSMFQSSRQRQTLADEDAPPMSSINDIPNEINLDSSSRAFQPRKSTLEPSKFSSSRRTAPSTGNTNQQPVYVYVFGYPSDKYTVTVEYFRSLGNIVDVERNDDLLNCFKIAYVDAGDAMRAVRKNGEVLGGSFMIGVKWADPAQAEVLLGQPLSRSTFSGPLSPIQNHTQGYPSDAMVLDDAAPQLSTTPSVGTPIRLAPSAAAFRQSTTGGLPVSKPATPQNHGAGATWIGASPPGLSNGGLGHNPPSPTKGIVGQAVDLIFGW